MNARKPLPEMTTHHLRSLVSKCIHCGLCLSSCPTYAVYGTEMDAPRGRISMIRALAEGRILINSTLGDHISMCLACRACESACPSGVQYGVLGEITRIALHESLGPGFLERAIRWFVLREVMPRGDRLRLIASLARLYEISGAQRLVRASGLLPKNLCAAEALLPPLTAKRPNYGTCAPAIGQYRGSVAFFYGCIQDAFLTQVNAATIRVLQLNGYSVHLPSSQTCCGAAQLHVGERELALDLARQNIDAFSTDQFEAIINNAGGCGALLKEYARLLEDDPEYAERAKSFVSKVKDVSEFLVDHLYKTPKGIVKARVTYSDSCHLRHSQKVSKQPRDLLRRIPGVELVELGLPDRCCGSAGVYNIIEVETANAVLDAKMADISSTGADTIVVTNTGCQLQLIAGVRRSRMKARVVHIVELLDQSYAAET